MAAGCRNIELGRSETLKDGRDLVLAYGSMVYPVLEAARDLKIPVANVPSDISGNADSVAELGIDIVRQGIENKQTAMRQILAELRLAPEGVCYIGDDLPDLSVMRSVGLGVAVADACEELRKAAHYVTTQPGGEGAVRETIELILKSQRRWEDLIQAY